MEPSCLGWATWSTFVSDRGYKISGYTSLYFAAHLINLEWAQHRSGIHKMFRSSIELKDGDGNELVTSYALHRSDGNWALMLVNTDQDHAHDVRIVFERATNKQSFYFTGDVRRISFGSEQYVWHDKGADSYPDPDGFPVGTTMPGGPDGAYTLPKASVTVLRGKVSGLGE